MLDQSCLSMVIRGTWIFDEQVDINTLKTGLKKLLNDYPHLSGRMKDKTGITLTNEGVPFTIVDEPDLLIKDVLKRDDFTNIKQFSSEIKTSRLRKGIDSPLSIKVTRFKDGSVLGVQCSHACMDGDSFYTMVYNWGQICRNQGFSKPILDQSLFPIADNL